MDGDDKGGREADGWEVLESRDALLLSFFFFFFFLGILLLNNDSQVEIP